MKESERHVLTIEDPAVIRSVLDALLAGVKPENGAPIGTHERLESLSKQGCEALVLNLRVLEEPLAEAPAIIKHVGASLVGGVLVVACQATRPWIYAIEDLRGNHLAPLTHHLAPKYWFASLGALVRMFF